MQFKKAQGVTIPEIGLGTYKLIGKECKNTVRQALDIGYRHIDTAQMYKNEREIGEAVKKSGIDRSKLFITTKTWYTNLEHDDVLHATENSLKELQTPYVDLLLIHWPNSQVSIRETFEAMLLLRDQGKVLNIGVANFPLSLLKEVIEEYRIPLFTDQVEFHPFLDQIDLLDYSYEHDFLITAYSPLAQGEAASHDKLKQIGANYGKTAAQIALRWLIEQENVIAIPKASSQDHLRENIDIFDFTLSDEDFEAIDNLEKNNRYVNPSFAPKW